MPEVRFHVIARRCLTLFHHAPGSFSRGFERFPSLIVAKLLGKIVKHTVGRNEVAITISINNVAHRFSRMFQQLLVSQRRISISANLLGAFFCLCNNPTGVANGLVQPCICLLAYVLNCFLGICSLVRGCDLRLFPQRLSLRTQTVRQT